MMMDNTVRLPVNASAARRAYSFEDMLCDVSNLRHLLVTLDDVMSDMSFIREGKRDEELDRIAALLRLACEHAKRVVEAGEEAMG